MRTYLRGKITLLFMTFGLLLAIPAIAIADNVQNDVGGSGISTITAGDTTTVNYRIGANSGDGQSGCNASDGSAANVTINTPAGVSASPNSLSFTSCGTDKPVVFSSNTAGDYDITVSVSDGGAGTYNINPAKFTLHVNPPPPPTNTPPTLNLPGNQSVEATGPGGATVTYTASATDAEDDPDPTPDCSPASGGTFPLGSTQVDCSVTDSGGLSASGFFTVTVVDTTPPELNLPANITKAATSNSQASVTYSASASDLVDGSVPVSCTPASPHTFGVGTTTVNCSATDAHGNTASGSFTVTVNYAWTGLFRPVDNPDTVNSVKAGSAVPVKFSLAGNQGLNIFAANFPVSQKITCDTSDPLDAIEETVTAGGSTLSYDSSLDQYNYVWKTDNSWAGTCRQLTVKTADGTPHIAIFKLLK
jgi:hypothetical protein